MWTAYAWIVVVGSFLSFFTAYGIGANDVANAFASSVGSKAITLTQAIILAAIFEFSGAVLLGAKVTNTIRRQIAYSEEFKEDPEILMYGMLCVLAATGIWLLLSSYLELPVSTTHSVIGAIVGMALVYKGRHSVVWYSYDSDRAEADLGRFHGVGPIVASWILSPILAAVVSLCLFVLIRFFILRHGDSDKRVLMLFPLLVGIVVTVYIYLVVYEGVSRRIEHRGEKRKLRDILGDWTHLLAIGSGILSAVAVVYTCLPWLRRKIAMSGQTRIAEPEMEMAAGPSTAAYEIRPDTPRAELDRVAVGTGRLLAVFDHEIHAVALEDRNVSEIHQAGEKFDPVTEEIFTYLQVFMAVCDSFSHGASTVANAIGPFAAIFMIYREQVAAPSADVPKWIPVLGGMGIVVGLATYGYRVIRSVGVRLVKLSPARGFAVELSAAMVVVFGKQCGIPLSTTHCQVGATVGVGLVEGWLGVNFGLLIKMIWAWLLTLIAAGGMAAVFFAQGTYSPSIPNLKTVNSYEESIMNMSTTLGEQLDIEAEVRSFNADIWEEKDDDSSRQMAQFEQWLREYTDTCSAR